MASKAIGYVQLGRFEYLMHKFTELDPQTQVKIMGWVSNCASFKSHKGVIDSPTGSKLHGFYDAEKGLFLTYEEMNGEIYNRMAVDLTK